MGATEPEAASLRAEMLKRASEEDLTLPKAVVRLLDEARAGNDAPDYSAAAGLGLAIVPSDFAKLAAVPTRVFSLTRLTRLSLKGNDLTRLPDGLGALTALVSLDASENKIAGALPPVLFHMLKKLKELDLSENAITALPDSVGGLAELERLVLFKNELAALPASLAKLSALRELNVFNNKITALPAELGEGLAALEDFNAGANKLTAFLPSVAAWRAVTRIALQDNKLRELPDLRPVRATLQQLQLQSNKLAALPELEGAARLTLLDVSSNEVAALPEWLPSLESLEHLVVKKNPLAALPDALCGCAALALVDAQMCSALASLPDRFDGAIAASLLTLLVSKSKVGRAPPSLRACAKLARLGLDQCPLDAADAAHVELLQDLKEVCERNGGFLRCAGTKLPTRPKKPAPAPAPAPAEDAGAGGAAAMPVA